MTLVEQLNRLHREIPGCRAVVFGDIETGTVLRACAEDGLRQEDHDALLNRAALCLRAPTSPLGQPVEDPVAPCRSVTVLDRGGINLFQRSLDAPGDVICIAAGAQESATEISRILQTVLCTDD